MNGRQPLVEIAGVPLRAGARRKKKKKKVKIGLPSLVNLDPGVGTGTSSTSARGGNEPACHLVLDRLPAGGWMIPSFMFVLVFCLARLWVKSTSDVAVSLSWLFM